MKKYEISMADGEITGCLGDGWDIKDGGALVVYTDKAFRVNQMAFGPGQWRMIWDTEDDVNE